MKSIYFLIIASLITSCNAQKEEAEKTNLEQVKSTNPSPINCYKYATANDTVILKVINVGNSITGTLVYILKEKDKNKGTIQGNMRGDILVADYTFMSEGIQSTRQVVFKKEGSSFVEGYGDFNKSIDSLNFNNSMKLTEVACQ